jgi:hypothetical protein
VTGLNQVIREFEKAKSFTKDSTLQEKNEALERFISIGDTWFFARPTVSIASDHPKLMC